MPIPPDSTAFRKVMSRFVTGITVVTSGSGERIHGMTCNAFCSVTIHSPTVLVCLYKGARTAQLIDETRVFAVNILSEDQAELSDRFAGRHKDKESNRFEGLTWSPGATGSPVFAGCQAHLDCKLVAAYEGGDHTIYLGEVVHAHVDENCHPLVYHHSKYLTLEAFKPL